MGLESRLTSESDAAAYDISNPTVYENPNARDYYQMDHWEIAGSMVAACGSVVGKMGKIRYSKAKDALFSTVKVKDRNTDASKKYLVSIPLGEIRRKVALEIARRRGKAQVSGVFDDISKAANSVVRTLGIDKLAGAVKDIVNSDVVKESLSAAGTVFPPLGITYAAVEKAANLVDGYANGDPSATEKLKEIAKRAMEGDPVAYRAAIALNAIYKSMTYGVTPSRQKGAALAAVKLNLTNPSDANSRKFIDRLNRYYGAMLSAPPANPTEVSGAFPKRLITGKRRTKRASMDRTSQKSMVIVGALASKRFTDGEALDDNELGRGRW